MIILAGFAHQGFGDAPLDGLANLVGMQGWQVQASVAPAHGQAVQRRHVAPRLDTECNAALEGVQAHRRG